MIGMQLIAAVALWHITPTVILIKRADAVRELTPDAQSFTARELHLSDQDAHKLHASVNWSPEDGVLTFYTGKSGETVVGVFLFVRVDTPHGPLEVAVDFGPDRTLKKVLVTKATVETKPWVQEALKAGLLSHYAGLAPSATPSAAATVKNAVGPMPGYMAEQIDRAVARALAAYADFYR